MTRLISLALGFLVLFAILLLVLGVRPRPCPRHICLPRSEIVTAEQLLALRKKEAEASQAGTTSTP